MEEYNVYFCTDLIGAIYLVETPMLGGVIFMAKSKKMNLATVVGLALKGKVHRQACINKGAPFAIPSDDGLVGLEMAVGDKCPLAC